MPEDAKNKFAFPKLTTPGPENLREVTDNGTKMRYKMSLNGLGVTKY